MRRLHENQDAFGATVAEGPVQWQELKRRAFESAGMGAV
jgi:hypothetical protein